MIPIDFSGHMFKDQGQITLLSLKGCPLYILLSLAYLLQTGFASTENMNFAPWGLYMFLKHFLFKQEFHCLKNELQLT